jgi:MFS family permease
MIASSYTLAATVSCMVVMLIGMRLGRRGCVLSGLGLVIIGGSLQASAWSVPQIIVARVLCVSLRQYILCPCPIADCTPQGFGIGVWCIGLETTFTLT